MSQINEELQRQMSADVGAAIKKVFGENTPAIDAKQINAEEREAAERLAKERLRALQAKLENSR